MNKGKIYVLEKEGPGVANVSAGSFYPLNERVGMLVIKSKTIGEEERGNWHVKMPFNTHKGFHVWSS